MFCHYPYRKHQTPPPIRLFLFIRPASVPTEVGIRVAATSATGRNYSRCSSGKSIGNGKYL